MFIFRDWTTSDSIGKIVGFVYNGKDVQDDHSRLIFTDRNKVVHEEDIVSLEYNSSTITFPQLSDSERELWYLKPSTAIFNVEKGKAKESCATCCIYSLALKNN